VNENWQGIRKIRVRQSVVPSVLPMTMRQISEAAFLPFVSRLGLKNALLGTTNGSEGGL
jgi:hypothetical protein